MPTPTKPTRPHRAPSDIARLMRSAHERARWGKISLTMTGAGAFLAQAYPGTEASAVAFKASMVAAGEAGVTNHTKAVDAAAEAAEKPTHTVTGQTPEDALLALIDKLPALPKKTKAAA